MATPARTTALEEIALLNALLTELLEQPGEEHQEQLWAQLRAQMGLTRRSGNRAPAFSRETIR